jgi:hypothetical protein
MATIDEVIAGMKVLAKYSKGKRPLFVYGEHDIISVGDVTKKEVSAEDQVELDKHGWHFDDEVDAWSRFT